MSNPPANFTTIPPGSPLASLVLLPSEKPVYTTYRETDARTGLARGLAEYLTQQSLIAQGGREVRFKQVFANWASPNDKSQYPSAAIYSQERGTYDWHALTPTTAKRFQLPAPPGQKPPALVKLAEFVQNFILDVWTNDSAMRANTCALLESALNPVDWMFGLRLNLPFYFNERGEYQMTDMQYLDDDESVTRGYRRVLYWIRASVPVLRVSGFPEARIKAETQVSSDVIVGPNVQTFS